MARPGLWPTTDQEATSTSTLVELLQTLTWLIILPPALVAARIAKAIAWRCTKRGCAILTPVTNGSSMTAPHYVMGTTGFPLTDVKTDGNGNNLGGLWELCVGLSRRVPILS